jgi:class 3 adenylate cyclase
MFKRFQQFFNLDTLPKDSRDHRYYIVGKITYLVAVPLHLSWIPLFYYLGVPQLVFFNMFSVLLFLTNIKLNQNGYYLTAAALAILEVITHQVLAVMYLGWDTGFQYYIISMLMLAFLTSIPKKILKFMLAGFTMFSFLLLEHFYRDAIAPILLDPLTVEILNKSNIFFAMLVIILWSYYFNRSVNAAEAALQRERQRSEDLLHNILPVPIADRLKQNEQTIADGYAKVSVLFLDIVGFTQLSSQKTPQELVALLNQVFSRLDDLAIKYNIEKIKTIGDAYMVAAGVPKESHDDAKRIANFAIDVLAMMETFNREHNQSLTVRIGINSGAVVAGVIGKKKFIYDLWGDAVNIASRMESNGVVGKVHVSEASFELLQNDFIFEKREPIDVKGKGVMQTYLLLEAK